MSKFNSDQIAKTQSLITGLKKNISLIKDKGLDEFFINNLKSENDGATILNEESEKLKSQFKAKVVETNAKLKDTKKLVKEAKRIIKEDFDKSQWHEFGISDLR